MMPVISAGFMRSMYKWQDLPMNDIPAQCQNNLEKIVRRALAVGINHLETARGYGSSERQLGRILPKIPRESFLFQTKVQPSADPDKFIADFYDSLKRLRLDRIDFLAIHGINDHRSLWHTCRKRGCLFAARKLQDKGVIGHVGFSGHGGTEVILEAVRHDEDGGFDYMNLQWYYIFQTHWPAICEAHQKDMGVFIISPTDKGGMLQKPPPTLVKLSKPLSPMLFNDLFCLSHPEITTISVGASVPADFEEHLKVVGLLENSDSLVEKIDSRWRDAMRKETGKGDPAVPFTEIPDWNQIPGYINIPFILWLFNLARGWDLYEYARKRYNMIGREGPWVPGRNTEGVDQYDFTGVLCKSTLSPEKIISRLKEAHVCLSD